MNAFRVLCLLALIGLTALSGAADQPRADKDTKTAKKGKDKDKQTEDADLGDVNAEVTALQVVYYLQLTPAQVIAVAKLAAKTAAEAPPRKVIKVSADFRKNLRALRDALARSDDDRVEELYDALDKLRAKESPEFDEVEVTDEARQHAPALFKSLSARQLAAYVGGVADFPDPAERLHEALEDSRKRKGNDWRSYRDDIAFEVGYLIAGLDTAAEEKVRRQVTTLLNAAQRLGDKEFKKDKPDLEKQARALTDKVGSLDVIRHYVQRVLAELLSNHRLAAALQRRDKKG